jgi:hypothetical protein
MHNEKQFDEWNVCKKNLDKRVFRKTFSERDVFFINVGESESVGFEQNGKGDEFLRPVLVYKKFSANTFLGIPLTTTEKSGKFYFSFRFHDKNSVAILSQIRLFDAKRLKYFCGRSGRETFSKLKEELIALLR